MARPDKVETVSDISTRFSNAEAALLTEYRGLSVGDMAELRTALREADADYKVFKNTLARIAVREVGLEELVELLEGPTAIAFIKGDAAAAAKALDEATRRYPVLQFKGGVLNGRVITADQARELAQLEPRDIQLTKIAIMVNAPLQQMANALSAVLRDLGSMLAQVMAKKEAEAPAPTEAEVPGATDAPDATETDTAGEAEGEEPASETPEEEPAPEATAGDDEDSSEEGKEE